MSVPVESIFPGDGATTVFTLTFALHGTFNGVIVTITDAGGIVLPQVEGADYTLSRQLGTITFVVPPAGGTTVKARRFTNRLRLQDYQSGATVLADENLDAEGHQIFDVLQELEHGGVTDVIIGGVVVDISSPALFTFSGFSAGTTDFTLTAMRLLTSAQAFVTVDSVLQFPIEDYVILNEDDTAYPTGGTGDDILRFVDPPPVGSIIRVVVLRGAVIATIPNEFITREMIQDGAVNAAKLSMAAGAVGRRFYVGDAAGVISVRQIGADDLALGGQTLHANFKAALTAQLRLNELATPNGPVEFGGQKASGLATGTAATDAVTVGQLAPNLGLIHHHTTQFSLAVGASQVFSLPFTPSIVTIHAGAGANEPSSMTYLFGSNGTQRLHNDPEGPGGALIMEVTRAGPSITIRNFTSSNATATIPRFAAIRLNAP